MNTIKERLLLLENERKDKDLEIIQLKQKVENIAENNVKLDLELKKARRSPRKCPKALEAVKSISELVVKEATEVLIKTISNQQNGAEKRNTAMFKTFHDQLDSLSNLLRTP